MATTTLYPNGLTPTARLDRRKVSNSDEHMAEMDEFFRGYHERQRRRRSSVAAIRQDQTAVDVQKANSNMLVISALVSTIFIGIIVLKYLYF